TNTAPANGLLVEGNVGIGTPSPAAQLHVHDPFNSINGSRLILTRAAGGSTIFDGLAVIAGPSNGYLWNYENGPVIFGTNNLERMRIDSVGNVGIGTSSPGIPGHINKLHVVGDATGSGPVTVVVQGSGNMSTGNTVGFQARGTVSGTEYVAQLGVDRFFDAAGVAYVSSSAPGGIAFSANNVTEHMRIGSNGNVGIGTTVPGFLLEVNGTAGKPGGGSWSVSSDIRLKKNVKPLENALQKMLQLRPVTFQWKEPEKEGNMTGTYMGMIAQEVEKVFPEWVGTKQNGYKTLTFVGFEALTTEAIRELKAENEELREELKDLRRMVQKLLAKNEGSSNRPLTSSK
ncbi:MAG: tail fiber domain-containing protein, partial [Limisphaerales bacterium]